MTDVMSEKLSVAVATSDSTAQTRYGCLDLSASVCIALCAPGEHSAYVDPDLALASMVVTLADRFYQYVKAGKPLLPGERLPAASTDPPGMPPMDMTPAGETPA